MKALTKRQTCELAEPPATPSYLRTKYTTVVIFEREGKTVIQPIASNEEAQALQELFQNNTLEVWLPNGKSEPAEFDVSILKYKPLLQLSTPCSKMRNRICLKNCFDTIVSCEQCPIEGQTAEEAASRQDTK